MPNLLQYTNFDLEISRDGNQYHARADSLGGQGSISFQIPFSDLEIENLLLKMGFARATRRGRDLSKLDTAKKFGGKLFQTVFTGQVGVCWQNSLMLADTQGLGLRLRLHLNDA